MARFWVWLLDDDTNVVSGELEPDLYSKLYDSEQAAEAFVDDNWPRLDYPEEVDVVVLNQVEGRTFEELLPEREVWTVTAHQDVRFAASPKEDE